MRIKKEPVTYVCDKCGGKHVAIGIIRVSSWDPWNVYRGSGRPMQHKSRLRLCKKHFKEFNAKINKLIYDY